MLKLGAPYHATRVTSRPVSVGGPSCRTIHEEGIYGASRSRNRRRSSPPHNPARQRAAIYPARPSGSKSVSRFTTAKHGKRGPKKKADKSENQQTFSFGRTGEFRDREFRDELTPILLRFKQLYRSFPNLSHRRNSAIRMHAGNRVHPDYASSVTLEEMRRGNAST